MIALFVGLIWFLNNQGAISLTFMPNTAEKNAEKTAEKKWDFELADGTKWYLDK